MLSPVLPVAIVLLDGGLKHLLGYANRVQNRLNQLVVPWSVFWGPALHHRPLTPFMFTSALAAVVLVVCAAGFCARLGFGADIESAERMLGSEKGKR